MQSITNQKNPRKGGGDLLQRMPYEAPDMQIVHIQIEKGFAQSGIGSNAGTVNRDDSWGDDDWPEQ